MTLSSPMTLRSCNVKDLFALVSFLRAIVSGISSTMFTAELSLRVQGHRTGNHGSLPS